MIFSSLFISVHHCTWMPLHWYVRKCCIAFFAPTHFRCVCVKVCVCSCTRDDLIDLFVPLFHWYSAHVHVFFICRMAMHLFGNNIGHVLARSVSTKADKNVTTDAIRSSSEIQPVNDASAGFHWPNHHRCYQTNGYRIMTSTDQLKVVRSSDDISNETRTNCMANDNVRPGPARSPNYHYYRSDLMS